MKPARKTWPVQQTTSETAASAYLDHLPGVFHDSDFLQAFPADLRDDLESMEQRQDQIAMYFDPRTCPTALLDWLASWLDIRDQPSLAGRTNTCPPG